MKEKVYILHKTGMNSHYSGLSHLLSKNNSKLMYREFSIFSKLYKSILKLDVKICYKQLVNTVFLLSLFFSKGKKIVVGIAPFDKKLLRLLPLFHRHQIYYHTSWANWDGSFVPKTKGVNEKVKKKWKFFIENVIQGVFCVTETTKNELIKNYTIQKNKLFVVNHSFDATSFYYDKKVQRQNNSFVVVGRLLPQKGIEEILSYFSKTSAANLTVVGSGKLAPLVEVYVQKHENISYIGYVDNKKDMARLLNKHHYILLNSKRTNKWEELFGMVLIEGMTCGLIPIATNHPGPKEIIGPEYGYLYKENNLSNTLDSIIKNGVDFSMKEKAIQVSALFSTEVVAQKWSAIF